MAIALADPIADNAVMLAHRKGATVCEIVVEGDDDCALPLGPLKDFAITLASQSDVSGVVDIPGRFYLL